MNDLAANGILAVTDEHLDPDSASDPGCHTPSNCSRFSRLVNQLTYGNTYRHLYGATAKISAKQFQWAGLAIPIAQAGTIVRNDILWRTEGDGGFGHVMLAIGDGRVVENSTVHRGEQPNGAKGYRQVADVLDTVSLVTRLPLPTPQGDAVASHWVVLIGDHKIICTTAPTGFTLCRADLWCEYLGLQAEWSAADGQVLVGGSPILAEDHTVALPVLVNGHALYPVRALAYSAGLTLGVDSAHRLITLSRPAA